MTDKPRYRVPAPSKPVNYTADSFQNVAARLGIGANNMSDYASYAMNSSTNITRNPRMLEAMYRSSWLIGVAVDSKAEDMTSAGIDFAATIKDPGIQQDLSGSMQELGVMEGITDNERWGQLYGGSIGIIMIDGQDPSTPLNLDTIRRGQFRGIMPVDRWCLGQPFNDLVQEMGPDMGKPRNYKVLINAQAFQGATIHHTRVIRSEGFRLPYYQRQVEQHWGISIVERIFDRLIAFDSATVGAGQLVYKAHLRTVKIEGLRKILAAGGPAMEALIKQMEYIRKFQSSEGLTMLDGGDDMQITAYTFSGLDDILTQFGQQISGAIQVPMVRLFGQSPKGLNATGESDLETYQQGIKRQQENKLRRPLTKVLEILYRSVVGRAPEDKLTFTFNPLKQLSETEKAEIANKTADTVMKVEAVISPQTALKELKQSSDVTGIMTNISDQEIDQADTEPPDFSELAGLGSVPGDPKNAPFGGKKLEGGGKETDQTTNGGDDGETGKSVNVHVH